MGPLNLWLGRLLHHQKQQSHFAVNLSGTITSTISHIHTAIHNSNKEVRRNCNRTFVLKRITLKCLAWECVHGNMAWSSHIACHWETWRPIYITLRKNNSMWYDNFIDITNVKTFRYSKNQGTHKAVTLFDLGSHFTPFHLHGSSSSGLHCSRTPSELTMAVLKLTRAWPANQKQSISFPTTEVIGTWSSHPTELGLFR